MDTTYSNEKNDDINNNDAPLQEQELGEIFRFNQPDQKKSQLEQQQQKQQDLRQKLQQLHHQPLFYASNRKKYNGFYRQRNYPLNYSCLQQVRNSFDNGQKNIYYRYKKPITYKSIKQHIPGDYVAHILDFLLLGDDFFLYMARMELGCKFHRSKFIAMRLFVLLTIRI